jgi:hypothetical protein
MSSLPKTPSPTAAGTKPVPTPPKGGGAPTPSKKVVPVYLDSETAKTLLTALALALSGSVDKKKKGKKATGKGAKGPVA